MWPLVFSRIIIGLIIFELTAAGLFINNKSYPLAALVSPLIFLTVAYKITMDKAYQRSTQFLPLQLLSEKLGPMTTIATSPPSSEQLQQRADLEASCSIHPLAPSTGDVVANGGGTVGGESSTTATKSVAPAALVTVSNHNSSSKKATMKNRKRRTVLDEDDYVAEPRKCTDFREPPMTLLDGILNTGMKQYGHPALLGVLPQIWLPVKATADLQKDREIVSINDNVGQQASPSTLSCFSISSISKRKTASAAVAGKYESLKS